MRIACLLPLVCLALLAQAPQPQEGTLRAHLAFLADPLLEGRGTGQRGGELASAKRAARVSQSDWLYNWNWIVWRQRAAHCIGSPSRRKANSLALY